MSFWYLATPYSKFPHGIEAAFHLACQQTALLMRAKVPVFCPIAHTHPVAMHGDIDPLASYDFWLPADRPFMQTAVGIIVCKLESWETSTGIAHEIEEFKKAGKPIVYMEPGVIPELPRTLATAGEVCGRAASLVGGDRQKTHGDKVENHQNIAGLWNAYLGWRLVSDGWLKPADVALMMALLKIARTKTGSHNLDDYVDLAGYAGVAAEIAERARG